MPKFLRSLLLVAFALALPAPLAAEPFVLAGPVPAEVTRIVDGDTLEVIAWIWLGQSVATRVRLDGIDAPERRGACPRERDLAAAARALVERRLGPGDGGRPRVRLRDIRFGKYAGRVLARVETASGEDLSQALVAAGLARPYDGGGRQAWCDLAAGAE